MNTAATALDCARLDAWLRANVPAYAGPVVVEPFAGGQSNPTFLLTARSGKYVLRRRPVGQLLPGAHAVDREFRVQRALANSPVPVARVYSLCEDDAVIGSAFYVMDYVDGRVPFDPRLPEMRPDERGAVYASMNETIARLHMIDPAAAGLADFGRPGNYLARQISRWTKQYRASETTAIAAMDNLIEWLPRHIPALDETRIVHGDYRIDNLILHKTEPRVAAVIDWELSTLGDPLVDFACHVMVWRFTPELFRGLAGGDLASLGIPTEAEYVAEYCTRTGRSVPAEWDYYIAFAMFRMAAISQGIMKRSLNGTAASEDAAYWGSRALPIAEQGWALARSLG
jgi:aminoglycoside phosphotransferase (APT) family kinase protein